MAIIIALMVIFVVQPLVPYAAAYRRMEQVEAWARRANADFPTDDPAIGFYAMVPKRAYADKPISFSLLIKVVAQDVNAETRARAWVNSREPPIEPGWQVEVGSSESDYWRELRAQVEQERATRNQESP